MAIVDIRMPPTHTDEGLIAAAEIRARHPGVGVLVLSHYLESVYAMRLLDEHPERVGYLLKDRVSDIAVLADALRRISDGESVLDPTIVTRLLSRPRERSPLAELTEHLYVRYEDRAVQHLLAVAAGLDSMVVGESQILGQVRQAIGLAREQGTLSRALDGLGTLALRTAKRAHTETGIDRAGENLVSVGVGLAAAELEPAGDE